MQDHALRVGEQLVIQDHVCLTILAVENGKVVLGITPERNGVPCPVDCPWQPRLAAVPRAMPSDN
jgi:hypothetical protein